ncbi:MAG: pyruvate kinase [Burkholderiales bacterium]|nr:pyruvate kinase [Burkholderiales bacterium]
MDSQPAIDTFAALADLARDVQTLRSTVLREQRRLLEAWRPFLIQKSFQPSAANLAAYIALRRHDLRELQTRLSAYGLSSLGRSEAHVMHNLDNVLQAIRMMLGGQPSPARAKHLGQPMLPCAPLARNTEGLLGPSPLNRTVRIMVTLPSQAATDYLFVRELVVRGMDCARINCAHDDRNTWAGMVSHVRRAVQETGRPCHVMMDLAGPRVRTGEIVAGPAVLHLKPKRDTQGRVMQPAQVVLDGSGAPGRPAERDALGRQIPARVAVAPDWVARLQVGDTIKILDSRGHNREMKVRVRISEQEVLADAEAGIYLTPETTLAVERETAGGMEAFAAPCGPILPLPMDIRVAQGDLLRLTRRPTAGEPARLDPDTDEVVPAHISCLPSDVHDYLEEGQPVFIDEGRIGARIEALDDEGALLRIIHVKAEGDKIRPEKGMNFPDSNLGLPALTERDLSDLDFVVSQADLVGYSFVQSADDMDRLVAALAERNAAHLGIVAKIETRRGVQNLPEIIAHGAGRHPFGVMIARGDLAVEIGFARLAEIQEEILWLCEAAHVPVIWATQVLENLIKRGIPSRAEMTDIAMAERAECVMINKGPFVLDAIAVLDDVVERMRGHQHKKTARLRALHW